MGCSGAPYLAAVPQDGWTGFLWYSLLPPYTLLVHLMLFLFLNYLQVHVAGLYTLQTVYVILSKNDYLES